MVSIFLSHNSEDKEFVRELHEFLKENGITSWIDEAEIKMGDSLLQKINEGIKDADYLAIILSPKSVKSNWVNYELEKAMNMEINNGKTIVIPILIEDCEIPTCINHKRWGDFRTVSKTISGMKELLHRLKEGNLIDKKSEMVTEKIPSTKKEMKITPQKKDFGKFKKIYNTSVTPRYAGGLGLNEILAMKIADLFSEKKEDLFNQFKSIYNTSVTPRYAGGLGLAPFEAIKVATKHVFP